MATEYHCQNCGSRVPDGDDTCDLCVAEVVEASQAEADRRAADEHEARDWAKKTDRQREAAIRWATYHGG